MYRGTSRGKNNISTENESFSRVVIIIKEEHCKTGVPNTILCMLLIKFHAPRRGEENACLFMCWPPASPVRSLVRVIAAYGVLCSLAQHPCNAPCWQLERLVYCVR